MIHVFENTIVHHQSNHLPVTEGFRQLSKRGWFEWSIPLVELCLEFIRRDREGILFVLFDHFLSQNFVWLKPQWYKHSNTTFRCNIDLENSSAQLLSFTVSYTRSSIPNKLLAFLPIYKLMFPLNLVHFLLFQAAFFSFCLETLCECALCGARAALEHQLNWS